MPLPPPDRTSLGLPAAAKPLAWRDTCTLIDPDHHE